MRETWKAAQVGLMVILGLAAIMFVRRYIDEGFSSGSEYRVYALFEDAQGLVPQSRVVIAGIPVGTIAGIRLQGEMARVDMNIYDSVPLYQDATVAMRTASLLGERVLVISPGTEGRPRIPDGGRIQTVRESVDTQDIMQTVSDIAESVRAVTAQLERSFGTDEAGLQMQGILRNLNAAIERINGLIQANAELVGRTIQHIEGITGDAGPRIQEILQNVQTATHEVMRVVENGRPDLERGVAEVDDTIASIHRAADQLDGVLADAREISSRTARGEGTIGRLTNDEALIDEVEGIAEGLNDVVGGIGRLRTIVELRSEYNFLANSFKTYFSLRLQPREGRYFLAQIVDDPRGAEEVSQTTVIRSPAPAGEPPVYQETRIRRTRDLRYTFQLAKSVSFATFRFGVMESSGGLGLDLSFFDDRLELNTDVFQIGVETFPRVRQRVAYEVVRRFWVLAGIDDALNRENIDFFLGLQLRFDDDDLKGILPFAGGLTP